jgi:2-phosphoglycerate kinase
MERRYLPALPLGGDAGPPWSTGLMARALGATGLAPAAADELARRAEADLLERNVDHLDLDRLGELAVELLGDRQAGKTMRRLRRLQTLRELDLPVVLLIGGATGTGKSTVATEIAHRLGITRVTSTDFIRQTMRALFSRELMPSVHFSSFEAGLGLTKAEEEEAGDATLLGFLDQTRNVLVGVEASVERALEEGWSMVLEGVHLVPGMLRVASSQALVVHVVLTVSDEELHRGHFWVRDSSTEGLRALDKYLDGLPEIRSIQASLVERAHRCDVPVVENTSLDDAIGAVLDIVLSRAESLARAV